MCDVNSLTSDDVFNTPTGSISELGIFYILFNKLRYVNEGVQPHPHITSIPWMPLQFYQIGYLWYQISVANSGFPVELGLF